MADASCGYAKLVRSGRSVSGVAQGLGSCSRGRGDVEADRGRTGPVRALIGRTHDAVSATGGDDVVPRRF